MIGRIATFILFALVCVTGPAANGYGGSLPGGQVSLVSDRYVSHSEEEIYRVNDRDQAVKQRMIDLCGRLEDDWIKADASRKSDVEVYRENTKPGVTEYRREIRESNRFAAPADEQRTIQLCHQLEGSAQVPQRTETRVYRETTVPR